MNTPPDPSAKPAEEIRAEIESLAREHLGVSSADALRMLNVGELDGTAIEVELRTRLFLLGEEPASVIDAMRRAGMTREGR